MYDLDAMISRIKDLKKEKDLSNESLSALSGVPKGTLAKILGNGTKDPQISSIIKIAQALGVSADYLVYGEVQSSALDLSPDEHQLLTGYRSLNRQGKEYMLQTLDMAARVYIKSGDLPGLEDRLG